MGKKTRNQGKLEKASRGPVRTQYTVEQRKAITKNIVESLTQHGLTMEADPGIKTLLETLADYQNSGERQSISIPIVHNRIEIYGVLPRYTNEEPAVGLRQLKPQA